jgi:hypothetical protein
MPQDCNCEELLELLNRRKAKPAKAAPTPKSEPKIAKEVMDPEKIKLKKRPRPRKVLKYQQKVDETSKAES